MDDVRWGAWALVGASSAVAAYFGALALAMIVLAVVSPVESPSTWTKCLGSADVFKKDYFFGGGGDDFTKTLPDARVT